MIRVITLISIISILCASVVFCEEWEESLLSFDKTCTNGRTTIRLTYTTFQQDDIFVNKEQEFINGKLYYQIDDAYVEIGDEYFIYHKQDTVHNGTQIATVWRIEKGFRRNYIPDTLNAINDAVLAAHPDRGPCFKKLASELAELIENPYKK